MKTSDYIIQELKKVNDRIFMVVGGGAMHLNDSVGRLMAYTCTHHEQAAAIAAEGYARISGRPGLCLVTSGPGVTNAITGLYGAWTDSIPMIFISGQMKTETLVGNSKLRQLGDQEVNAIPLVASLTKMAIQPVPGIFDIKYCLQKAIYESVANRPGPVWIDVPLDIQAAEMDPDTMTDFRKPKVTWWMDDSVIQDINNRLRNAERPLIIAGNGIRLGHAVAKFGTYAHLTHIPYVTSFDSMDLECPKDHGPFGTIGTNCANDLVQHADVILIFGCRMNIRQIGYDFGKLAKQAYKIMVDIDEAELKKSSFQPDLPVLSPISLLLDRLDIRLPYKHEWLNYCRERSMEDAVKMPLLPDVDGCVNPYRVIQVLNRFLKSGDTVASANGMASIVAAQMLDITPRMRFLVNSGAAPMGYGLPLAIGASFASPNHRVICLEGDGSIQMNIQELQTVVYHNLPIKIILFNNSGYNSIRNTQDAYFEGRYVGADQYSGVSFPDMEKIAAAYGISYCRAEENGELQKALNTLFNTTGPAICEVKVDPKAKPMPKGIKYE